MKSCTMCSPGQHGYFVEFDSAESQFKAHEFLSERSLSFEKVQTGKSWIAAQALRDCMECCALFAPVQTWVFQRCTRFGAAEFMAEGECSSWNETSAELPSVFIDTLIQDNAIRMMRQPIMDVATGVVVAYEMLARGFDAAGEMISSAILFGEARAQNRLFALDKACRIEGVKSAAHVPGDALVFINFIPTAIYRPEHCLQTTMAAARSVGFDFGRLVFEVVETDYVEDKAHLKTIFDFYRRNGVRCALDDVGAGFNDVEMLKSLSPDIIKLDRSIADGVAASAEKQKQAAAVQSAAAQVGAIPLAEGIESKSDANVLAMMGYHWQQGYLYGKPSFFTASQSGYASAAKLAA